MRIAVAWGPADYYVVGSGVLVCVGLLLRLLWTMTDPWSWSAWRDTFRRCPPADPRDRVPYRRPPS